MPGPRPAPTPPLLLLPAELAPRLVRGCEARDLLSLSATCRALREALREHAREEALQLVLVAIRRLFDAESPLAAGPSREQCAAHDEMVRSRWVGSGGVVIEDDDEEVNRCREKLVDSGALWSDSLLAASASALLEIVRFVAACEARFQ